MERYTCASIYRGTLDKYLKMAVAATLMNGHDLGISVIISKTAALCLNTKIGRQNNVEKVEISKVTADSEIWSITWEADSEHALLQGAEQSTPKLTIAPNRVILIDEELEDNYKCLYEQAMGDFAK